MEREILNAQWADAKQHYWAFRHGLGRPDIAAQLLEEVLWQEGPICPKCGLSKRSVLITEPSSLDPREWKCSGCAKIHSVRHGTWLQDEPATLDQVVFAIASIGLEGPDFAIEALSLKAGLPETEATALVESLEKNVFAENGHPKGQRPPAQAPAPFVGMPKRKPARRSLTLVTSIAGAALVWAWINVRPEFFQSGNATHAAGFSISKPVAEDPEGDILVDNWSYSVNGSPINTKIVTNRRAFSSSEDWHAAHRRSVMLMKSRFPPIQ